MPIYTSAGKSPPARPTLPSSPPLISPFPAQVAPDLDAQLERASRFGHSLERLTEPPASAAPPVSRSPIQLGRKRKRSRAKPRLDDEPEQQEKGKEERDEEPVLAQETGKEKAKDEDAPRKKVKRSPRSRARDPLSEGESESEDPDIGFRSLRTDEDPFTHGLLPPEGHDPLISARAHVSAGTRAKKKSPWVSLSRSRKVAAGWASENRGGRVAKVRIPPEARESGGVFDLTDPEQAKHVFPTLEGSSYNTAKASQEVLVKGGLGKEHILDVLRARKLSVKQYNELDPKDPLLYAKLRTRTKTTGRPLPRVLEKIPK